MCLSNHFTDNDTLESCGSPGYDRLGKVGPVIKGRKGTE